MSITTDIFQITGPAGASVCSTFRAAGASGNQIEAVQVPGTMIYLQGQHVLLSEYLRSRMEHLYEQHMPSFRTAHLLNGTYPLQVAEEHTFAPGECVINGRDMEYVRIDVEYRVQVVHPPVISDFEVATRGRVIRLGTTVLCDHAIDISFVKTCNTV
jgi:hypothetical protein